MSHIIYILAGISIILAIGGISAYSQTKQIGLLLSSVVSIGFSVLAIVLIQFWPLVAGFIINWLLRLAGLDSKYKS
jgi:hypothetical protein